MGDEDTYLTQPDRPSYVFIALLSPTKNTQVVSPLRRSIKETFDTATIKTNKNQVDTDIVKSPHRSRSREKQIDLNRLRIFVHTSDETYISLPEQNASPPSLIPLAGVRKLPFPSSTPPNFCTNKRLKKSAVL